MQEDIKEKELIARAKNGDNPAFEELILKYQKKIYSLCYRMTSEHYSADDLAQETFVKAYFNLGSFREEESFYPWLRKIAVNLTLNYIRDRRRLIPLAEHSNKFSNFPSRENISNPDSDLEIKIEIAINSLPAGLKAVFVLKHHERQSYKEISKTLKIPVGTVMSRLNRAREKLKSALFPYLKGGLNEAQKD